MCPSTHKGIPEEEERERVAQKCIRWNYVWNLPKSEEGNTHPGIGSTGGSKLDESKEIYSKTYHNQNGKR